MADYVFKVSVPFALDPLRFVDAANPRETPLRIARLFRRLFADMQSAGAALVCDTGTSGATAATGTLTIASGTGAVGGTINGTLVTVTWGTSDTASATALAAAINAAAAIVSDHVVASAAAGVVTLTAKTPGPPGNAVTLVASGTGVTASGARLTGGASTRTAFTY